jgi:diguanylate cyclase (GGDEF)-like protein/PAS domain S-box-containing protein
MQDNQGPVQPSPERQRSAPAGGRNSKSFTLQRKVLAAFGCLVVIVVFCGAAGLIFFERIAASVSVLSAVSSPLLIESMTLQRNADRMQSVLFENGDFADTSDEQLSSLDKLDDDAQRHTAKLKRLAEGLGLVSQFEAVEQLQDGFVATLRDIVRARARRVQAETSIFSIYSKVHAATSKAEVLTLNLAPLLTSAGVFDAAGKRVDQLSAHIAAGHNLAADVLVVGGELDLDRLESAIESFNASAAAQLAELKALVSTSVGQAGLARVEAALKELHERLLAPDGLLARKRQALEAAAIFTARSKKLNEIQTRYTEVLSGITYAVRRQNDVSEAQTGEAIAQGRAAVIGLVGVAAALATAAAIFLIISISRPLRRLTAHVQNVREQGDLIPISDPGLLAAKDELGDLSRMFNGMILELMEARRELIARSEAEITKQAERLKAAVDNMSQGLCMYDAEQRLIISNDRYAEIYGIPPEQIHAGMSVREILELRLATGGYYGDAGSYSTRRISASQENNPAQYVVELQNGRIVQIVRQPLKNGGWVATHEDITERRQIEAKIAHMAHHDVLTNLPNRVLFRDKMDEALTRVSRGEMIAVICLDLDHFKTVNDTLGHSTGDAVLREVTTRLLGCIGGSDTIARLGGDEFAIIQAGVKEPQDAAALAQQIINTMTEPLTIEAHQIPIGTSIGIALSPSDGTQAEELLQKADFALYRAKADGRGSSRFFEAEMDAQMRSRRALELDLYNALSGGQFELFYQPLVNLKSGQISAFEALLRWRHPERGLVAPDQFIPLAEDVGLIVPIGEWVVHEACREAVNWPESVHVAVNLSPAQFKSRNLVQTIALALSNSGLAPERLELEITESVLLYENQNALATLTQIKALGVKISMDDFGTGYSSLSYLRSFPFDKIKIDRSFIHDLTSSDDCVAIVRAVTSLGASLGMSTTAEGVETTEQLERLRLEGCAEIQGFLISPPRSATEIAPLLDKLRENAAA